MKSSVGHLAVAHPLKLACDCNSRWLLISVVNMSKFSGGSGSDDDGDAHQRHHWPVPRFVRRTMSKAHSGTGNPHANTLV